MTSVDKHLSLLDWIDLKAKISAVQWMVLSNMRNRNLPVAIRIGIDRIDYEFVNRHGGTSDQWLWAGSSTVTAMRRRGWIEWRDGDTEKRAGYYITDAGREVLPT